MKTHLPCLKELTIKYDDLVKVTEHFTRETTRLNCKKIIQLNMNAIIPTTKNISVYFPSLKWRSFFGIN